MKSIKFESLSLNFPFLNVSFKIADDIEQEIANITTAPD